MAHDGQFLYIKLTDPCGDVKKLGDGYIFDTLELFTANSRSNPYRHFMAFSGGKKKFEAILQGEVSWQRDVPFADHHIRNDVMFPDAKTEVILLAMPLDEIVPGGNKLKPGKKFYMNAVRVTPAGLTPQEDRVGAGYGIDTLVPYCGLWEIDRLAEFTLAEK